MPVVVSSSCVETLQRFAGAAGFSSRVAGQLCRSRRSSFLTVYQSKWAVYRRWCKEKGHSSSSPSIPKIAEFLLWLWRSKGLSLADVKAYRAMLSAVFSLKLPGISSDHVLRNLIRSFAVERPRGPVAHPSWDLDVVLHHCHLRRMNLWSPRLCGLLLKSIFVQFYPSKERMRVVVLAHSLVERIGCVQFERLFKLLILQTTFERVIG